MFCAPAENRLSGLPPSERSESRGGGREPWKEGIHPKLTQRSRLRCACGNTFKTRSTKPELHLEICSACHPFFTGRQKLIDTEGRVERFTKKFGAQTAAQRKTAATAAKVAAKKPTASGTKAKKAD